MTIHGSTAVRLHNAFPWTTDTVLSNLNFSTGYTILQFVYIGLVWGTLINVIDVGRSRQVSLAWLCPSIANFWILIFSKLSEITGETLRPDPLLALLCFSKRIRKDIRRLIDMGLLMAKWVVAIHWACGPPPTLTHWPRDMLFCNTQTEAYSELLPPRSRPKNFWGLYKSYLEGQK